MFEAINNAVLTVGDPLLGWMLNLPRDLVLIFVALGTALVLTVVRRWTTNQDRLGRAKADKRRLKELTREAKARGDKDAVKRYRTSLQQIGIMSMKAEGKPLLASLLPIAVIAVWAFSNINYQPPTPGEPVTVKAYFPISAIGETAHIVPADGLSDVGGTWVREIKPGYDPKGKEITDGQATWDLEASSRPEPYTLEVRHAGETVTKELIVDGKRYATPLVFYNDKDEEAFTAVELVMPEYKPFGIVPGWAGAGLQPWIVGYLIIVIPLSVVLKPVLRTY